MLTTASPPTRSKFVSEHGGHTNAYTSNESTNYHFDTNWDQLEPALDRCTRGGWCEVGEGVRMRLCAIAGDASLRDLPRPRHAAVDEARAPSGMAIS